MRLRSESIQDPILTPPTPTSNKVPLENLAQSGNACKIRSQSGLNMPCGQIKSSSLLRISYDELTAGNESEQGLCQ